MTTKVLYNAFGTLKGEYLLWPPCFTDKENEAQKLNILSNVTQ